MNVYVVGVVGWGGWVGWGVLEGYEWLGRRGRRGTAPLYDICYIKGKQFISSSNNCTHQLNEAN